MERLEIDACSHQQFSLDLRVPMAQDALISHTPKFLIRLNCAAFSCQTEYWAHYHYPWRDLH